VSGRDLSRALSDCNTALALRPDDRGILNSRGLVHFKLRTFKQSIADYDSAMKQDDKDPASLYARGLAKLKSGDVASGNADMTAAKAITPDVAAVYADYGLK
jgi:lipoprotein NlpI